MNNIRYFELLQKYTELQKAFDDTLEMNRKFGTENVRLEEENEQLKTQIEKMKFCQNCKYGRALSYEEPCLYCSRCFANEGKEGLKDYWELAE